MKLQSIPIGMRDATLVVGGIAVASWRLSDAAVVKAGFVALAFVSVTAFTSVGIGGNSLKGAIPS